MCGPIHANTRRFRGTPPPPRRTHRLFRHISRRQKARCEIASVAVALDKRKTKLLCCILHAPHRLWSAFQEMIFGTVALNGNHDLYCLVWNLGQGARKKNDMMMLLLDRSIATLAPLDLVTSAQHASRARDNMAFVFCFSFVFCYALPVSLRLQL